MTNEPRKQGISEIRRLLFFVVSAASFTLAGCNPSGSTLSGQASRAGLTATPSRTHHSQDDLKTAAKDIARNFDMRYATDELDAWAKSYFEESAGDALRTLENDTASAGVSEIAPLVKKALDDWLPDRAHWSVFTDQVTRLITHYVDKHPRDPQAANEALEQVAQGLQAVNAPPD